jgi:nuclear receptor interaction protein
MPYSNDRTIVSATDDVKIFDIEHSGHSALRTGSNRSNTGSSRSMAMSRDNVTLTRGDTRLQVSF